MEERRLTPIVVLFFRSRLPAYVARGIAGVLVFSALICTNIASANDAEACSQAEGRTSIDACTRLLQSGKLPRSEVAFTYVSRGLALSRINNLERAILDYSEAIRIDPKYAAALSNRCALYVRLGKFDLAIQDCDQAIKLDVRHVNAHINRGNAFRQKTG